jgi:oligopeptide/dipeptide ABC transporter ATP-binding protein
MPQNGADAPILEVQNLSKYFFERTSFLSREKSVLKAVNRVSLSVSKGEVLGLVGESGCGKTTLGRTIARLYEATDGKIIFRRFNEDDGSAEEILVNDLDRRELKRLRRDIQVIFQDPQSSLNARWNVKSIISEPLVVQGLSKGIDINDYVADLLKRVGLSPDHMQRYPHEFSGGQRQRIGIARALALRPQLVIADEPVSALDVSIQAQILNLLQDLQDEFNLTYIFIAHDLLVVEYVSNRIAVMYLGRIVELSSSDKLFRHPLHPYTEALLSAVPVPDPQYRVKPILLQGDVPSPTDVPAGCPFHPRCGYFKEGLCDQEVPSLREVEKDHFVSCHRAEEISLKGLDQLLNL